MTPYSISHPAGWTTTPWETVFEELVRRFNEENNEEAGEHWTPRDAIRLMTRLMFEAIADKIQSGSYLLYDGAMGTGGMLTVAEETLEQLTAERGKQVKTHLFGQETNAETHATAQADLILKGAGEAADNIVGIVELGERRILLRALREGVDTATRPDGLSPRSCPRSLSSSSSWVESAALHPESLAAPPAAGHQAGQAQPRTAGAATAISHDRRTRPRTCRGIRHWPSHRLPLPGSTPTLLGPRPAKEPCS